MPMPVLHRLLPGITITYIQYGMLRPGQSVPHPHIIIVLPPHIQPSSSPPSSLLLLLPPAPTVGPGLDTGGLHLGRNLNR